MLGAVGARNELVDNAAALRAWDVEDIEEAPVRAVDQILRHGTLSPWLPISGREKWIMRRAPRDWT